MTRAEFVGHLTLEHSTALQNYWVGRAIAWKLSDRDVTRVSVPPINAISLPHINALCFVTYRAFA